jgi:hypothetical protein
MNGFFGNHCVMPRCCLADKICDETATEARMALGALSDFSQVQEVRAGMAKFSILRRRPTTKTTRKK